MKRNVAAQKIRRTRTKRQKKQQFIFLRRVWSSVGILSLVVVVVLGFFLFASVQTFWIHCEHITQEVLGDFFRNRGCTLQKITIEGLSLEDAEVLKKKLGLKPGTPFLKIDPWRIKETLEKSPLVHKVLVERRFPDELSIKISERVPMARWQHNKKIRLIDHQGRVMPPNFKEKIPQEAGLGAGSFSKNLPLFIGEEAPQKGVLFLKKIQNYEEITRQITALNNVSNRRWNIYLNGDLEVRLPEDDVEEALKKLSELEQEGLLTVRKVQMIDLRYLPKVIVRPREGVNLENIFQKPKGESRPLDLDSLSGNKKET